MPSIEGITGQLATKLDTMYRQSSHGPGFIQCVHCRAHLLKSEVVNDNGDCPGCTYVAEQNHTIRGGL